MKMHTVCGVKHDFRHKVWIVVRGDLTPIPTDSVCSGVVSLRALCTPILLGEHNDITPWTTDAGNSCLEKNTCEKACIKARPEIGKLAGKLLLIDRALHGLLFLGRMFEELLAGFLLELGFERSRTERNIWMRRMFDDSMIRLSKH